MREALRENFIPKLKETTAQEVQCGHSFQTFSAVIHSKKYILHWQLVTIPSFTFFLRYTYKILSIYLSNVSIHYCVL